ncbi:MAG: 4-hydroxy-tetrahydrodipicolinate reductase, partial [Dermabacter sp.]|nr:4-hydroxy-tetrahydrodipicolinate reductase [Dermabacter sp.]
MSIRVGVIGSAGRMGSEVVRALEAASDLDFVRGITAEDSLEQLLDDDGAPLVDVAVDFTLPSVTKANVLWLIEHGIHAVVGATGWDDAALADVRAALDDTPETGVLIAPNFAIG